MMYARRLVKTTDNKSLFIGCCLVLLAIFARPISAQEVSASLVVDSSFFDVEGQDKYHTSRGLLDISVEHSQNNWTFFANVQAQRGNNGSDYVGDIQAFSNIDEDDFEKLYEAWLAYEIGDTGTQVKLGQIDMNGEFAFADNAGEFINSSMGFSPTIFVLPTYPDPALGIVLTQSFADQQLAIGVNAGADTDDFSDKFYIAEWRYLSEDLIVKLGIWHHDGDFERLDGNRFIEGTDGWYAIAEGQLDTLPIGYYFQFGSAESALSEISQHLGLGITTDAIGNEHLSVGAGISAVELSEHLATAKEREVAVELFARYQLSDHVAIKPDLQYIASPSGEDRNEWVTTLRWELSF